MNESAGRLEPRLLEKIRASNTTFRCRICTIQIIQAESSDIEIKPRNIGEDTQGWSVGEAEIPTNTLEEAIIVGMEIQARE